MAPAAGVVRPMAGKQARLWDGSIGVAANAKKVLPRLAARFFRKGRKLLAGNPSYDQLHTFRLEAKRFRYTLELFRPLYGPGLEQKLASLRQLQQSLGELNDCVVTRTLLENSGVRRSPGFGRLMRALERQASRIAADYRRCWRKQFDRPGKEQQWISYLRNFAGRAGRRNA